MKQLLLFGTLKQGFPLHSRALSNATYRGPYKTTERFPMFVAGNWFAPMMMNEPGTGQRRRRWLCLTYNSKKRKRRLSPSPGISRNKTAGAAEGENHAHQHLVPVRFRAGLAGHYPGSRAPVVASP